MCLVTPLCGGRGPEPPCVKIRGRWNKYHTLKPGRLRSTDEESQYNLISEMIRSPPKGYMGMSWQTLSVVAILAVGLLVILG